ncbi:MAG: hypothetical protein K940chlam3_00592 [Chlamydiae bacterium]|nr:hypothetical protein [Chlamydiota bacterium]
MECSTKVFMTNMEELFSEQCVDKDLECIICMETFTNPHILISCFHVFCRDCIDDCRTRDSKCPICRIEFEAEQIIPSPEHEKLLAELTQDIIKKTLITEKPKEKQPAPVESKSSDGIEELLLEEQVDIEEISEHIDITSVFEGITALNCSNLRNLSARGEIRLINVSANSVISHKNKILIMGSPKRLSAFKKIEAKKKICLVFTSSDYVKSRKSTVATRCSQIKYIEAVKEVTLSGSTVSNITLEAYFEEENPIAQATLDLIKHDEGRENRIEGLISIIPPENSDARNPRVQLSITGKGFITGKIQFVNCRGEIRSSEKIILS